MYAFYEWYHIGNVGYPYWQTSKDRFCTNNGHKHSSILSIGHYGVLNVYCPPLNLNTWSLVNGAVLGEVVGRFNFSGENIQLGRSFQTSSIWHTAQLLPPWGCRWENLISVTCFLLPCTPTMINSYPSGVMSQRNSSFYKLPWSWCFITATENHLI